MRYVKPGWRGYLEVHETKSGYTCFFCNDVEFQRMALTLEHMESLELSIPRGYKLIYKNRAEAEKVLAHIARLSGFTKVLKP